MENNNLDNDATAHAADDYEAYALEAIERSEQAGEPRDRFELLARAQVWAMLRVGDVLKRAVEASTDRRADW